eukprot:23025-Prorocentrum_minimum.AAC.1
MYLREGGGLARDPPRAAEVLRWAAAQGGTPSARALFTLGSMHQAGVGVPRDLHLAKRYAAPPLYNTSLI